jgi:hypothetical protein
MKKTVKIALLIIAPIILKAQQERGFHVFKGDSLYVEKFYRPGLGSLLERATYTNGRVKYELNIKDGTVLSPVVYFDELGDTIAVVDYEKLEYTLSKDSHLNSYEFIDTAIQVATAYLYSLVDSAFIEKNLFFDARVSHQFAVNRKNHHACRSWLYEPLNYDLNECFILFSHKRMDNKLWQGGIFFKIDTTLRILETNIPMDKKIQINYTYEMADSIRLAYGMVDKIDLERKKGTKIRGPLFKFERRNPIWEIEAQNGDLLSNTLAGFIADYKSTRVISINAITGEVKETVRISSDGCY